MSENLHDIPLSEDPGKKNQETLSRPLSLTTIEQVKNDPRIQKLGQDPEKRGAIIAFLQKNEVPLSQWDNTVEQARIKTEWLKELGYGHMASNGESFEKLAALSSEEMGKLPFGIRMEVKKWQKEKLDNVLVSKEVESKELDKDVGSKIIDSQEFQKKITEVDKEVDKLTARFTENDNTFLDTSLESAKSWKVDNAAVEELKKKGATQADIQSGKYDNYISASIIIENASKFEAYQKDPKGFTDSIRSLQSLGIPVRVQWDFQQYSEQIDSRFAPGDRRDAATYAVRDGLNTWEYKSLHYDGLGEQYTLIGTDGITRKDIIMDKPPRAEIRMSTLHIGHEISPPTQDENKRQEYIEAYKKNYESAQKIEVHPVPESDPQKSEVMNTLYEKAFKREWNPAENIQDRIRVIEQLKRLNQERKDKNLSNSLTNLQSPEPKNSQFEAEIRNLEKLETNYKTEKAIFESVQKLPPDRSDDFDTTAKKNLRWLLENHFDRMGPASQEAVDQIIAYENRGRTEATKIHLDKPIDPKKDDAKILKNDLAKLGITPESVKTDTLTSTQKDIGQMLSKNPWDTGSIERKLSTDQAEWWNKETK